MSNLEKRLEKLEQTSGEVVIAIYDETIHSPDIEGEQAGKVNVKGEWLTLEEFEKRYPDGILVRIVDEDISYG